MDLRELRPEIIAKQMLCKLGVWCVLFIQCLCVFSFITATFYRNMQLSHLHKTEQGDVT